MTEPDLVPALIAELGKKTGVSWLTYATGYDDTKHTHAAWHVWVETEEHGGALYVVAGGDEQHLPGRERADRVEVTMRSKENGGRLVTWVAEPSRVTPDDPAWDTVTAALAAGRLNLDDLTTAARKWAQSSVITRLKPTGETVEQPGELSADDHRATPRETPAITRGRLPRVLHRRVKRRPRLS